MNNNKYIRTFIILLALFMGAASETWALDGSDIIIDSSITNGTVVVKGVANRTVTITVTPASNYYVKLEDIVVQKLLDPVNAPTRRNTPAIADALPVTSLSGLDATDVQDDYTFTVPADYGGALVTVTFSAKSSASAEVIVNSLTYDRTAQPLVTLGTVTGGKGEHPVTYSVDDVNGTYSSTIPTATDAGTYTVYYEVDPDVQHSKGSGFVEVTIAPASLTEVTVVNHIRNFNNSEQTFDVDVEAGNLTGLVETSDYNISDNKQTNIGNYTLTVTGIGNYTGTLTAGFRIVEAAAVVIYSSTNLGNSPSMSANYILAENVNASVVNALYTASTTTPFTGTFEAGADDDGNFFRISGLTHALFNKINGGKVCNVVIAEGTTIGANNSGNAGAIANEASGASRIYNCGVLGKVTRTTGITGEVTVTSTSSVTGTANVGGIVGLLGGTSRVINCYSYANIINGNNVGGIVGNNNVTTNRGSINTMVMNCLFYGNITGGTTKSPVYGGKIITNLKDASDRTKDGLNTFNYYCYENLTATIADANYKCALAVEEKYLNRFEFYRELLNSNKKLAAWYVTGDVADEGIMAKWVLETADRTISNPNPYPVLKAQGRYPSIINIDADNAPDSTSVGRYKGGNLGKTLSVKISGVGTDAPTGAKLLDENGNEITESRTITLMRTDKDEERFNFNYDKVQLPYYNDYGTKNYTNNMVVTGWKITDVEGGTPGTFTEGDAWGGYNFADRRCTNKDLYGTDGSNRVFSQGAYYDVPYGVTAITIEPYWGQAAYVSDVNYDVVYDVSYNSQSIDEMGTQNTSITINGSTQTVYSSIEAARSSMDITSGNVYDHAVVLVGNAHQSTELSYENTPYTIMSVDLDKDNEPDYSFIFSHSDRKGVSPIRFDFLNVIGTAQAQKPNGTKTFRNVSIFNPTGWFEVTNTCLIYFVQFECDNSNNSSYTNSDKAMAPVIFLGGVIDQFTSTKQSATADIKNTSYVHVGGNAWFKAFGYGTHSDGTGASPHIPISVTGGDFDGFYLSGTYNPSVNALTDNAEGYISGGRFMEIAGASQEQIKGNVRWQIYDADIKDFYGGGVNNAKPITGDIEVDIINSDVETYCGGPKFGNMSDDKKVITRAIGCTFGKYFGAGFGGTSYLRAKYYDESSKMDFPTWEKDFIGEGKDRGKYFNGTTNTNNSHTNYGKKGPGVASDFDYEFFVWSSGTTGGRYYVKFATFSLAKTHDVYSTLTNCTIKEDFYGGGSLGKVEGTATSVLDGCTVYGNVFGAGYSATLPTIEVRNGGFNEKFPKVNGYSGMLEPGKLTGTTTYHWVQKPGSYFTNEAAGIDSENKEIYTDQDLTTLGQVTTADLTLTGNCFVAGKVENGVNYGGVFGGGDESAVNGNTTVKIQTTGERTIKNVYGGGNVANVVGKTTVSLISGTVSGDVYGGGKGRLAVDAVGTEGEPGYVAPVTPIAATVGAATVELNKNVADDAKGCVVGGDIFGCNNLNGTPLGAVTVHVYKTQRAGATRITNGGEENNAKVKGTAGVASSYDVKHVYGGGNLAAYKPTNSELEYNETNKSTLDGLYAHVIIDGCDRTSIYQVYGGGNAASSPATRVDINGTYEIEEVFGGGNGKDQITKDGTNYIDNPGANVGYYEFDDTDPDYDTKEERTALGTALAYGAGATQVNVYGGEVHHVYGGSNTRGNVRRLAKVSLEEQMDGEDKPLCSFKVAEAYGGGKSAAMDGETQLEMKCIPGLDAVYGGSENADILNNVTLNITNGKYGQVFGGNNRGGRLGGKITVNVEETGCRPIIIGELYGGGNRAAYSVYGYTEERDENNDVVHDVDGKIKWQPLKGGDTGALVTPYDDPEVNVKSFTSIGDIYGGGYGETAVMVGDPEVNINVVVGDRTNHDEAKIDAEGTITITEELTPGNTTTRDVKYPTHVKGKIGAIDNVFGGGNAARVIGNPTVNVGTASSVTYVTKATGDADYRTFNTGIGADIRGNVYGGGNEADVTGDTKVNIGKENQ